MSLLRGKFSFPLRLLQKIYTVVFKAPMGSQNVPAVPLRSGRSPFKTQNEPTRSRKTWRRAASADEAVRSFTVFSFGSV